MALTNDQITAQNFKEFYGQIRPYLNGAAHSGFTPVGVVISVMGKTAPLNYLVCDGTIYNIADYPELAAYFARQFDVCNYFGGDGTTTFAVPDLRGEFLRGTGTNGHTNQGSGANVGVHQDATQHIYGYTEPSNGALIHGVGAKDMTDLDTVVTGVGYNAFLGNIHQGSDINKFYTSRPTNTSVLYCIAYKNIFVDEGCNYSTDERVVGTWIDGKPLYQKTVKITSTMSSGYHTIPISANIEDVVMSNIFAKDGNNNIAIIPNGNYDSRYNTQAYINTSGEVILTIGSNIIYHDTIITIQYTKTTD